MNSQPTQRRIWPAVIWVLVFAILMGVRPEFSSMWVRAVVAGCAGGALGWGIWAASSRRSWQRRRRYWVVRPLCCDLLFQYWLLRFSRGWLAAPAGM